MYSKEIGVNISEQRWFLVNLGWICQIYQVGDQSRNLSFGECRDHGRRLFFRGARSHKRQAEGSNDHMRIRLSLLGGEQAHIQNNGGEVYSEGFKEISEFPSKLPDVRESAESELGETFPSMRRSQFPHWVDYFSIRRPCRLYLLHLVWTIWNLY